MVVRDGAAIRKGRLNALMKLVMDHEEEPEWTRRRVVGTFILQTGLKTRTINEMIGELIDAGIMSNKGDKLHMEI